ncbi:hypothetical protein VTK73DRAFT_7191 [Phialemonium thermophilum]|uniref:Uncharacterized protein n=1 Tax=Phialemonium thermophilum TaxID=223376 RepID=A0ABR3WFY1_9PEZI
MGSRIVVKYKSDKVPGDPKMRLQTLANIVCQRIWQREFDETQDRVHSSGQYDYDGVRCYLLLDNGPPRSQEVRVSMYSWDGSSLKEMPVSPLVRARLQHYPFDPAERSRGYSDEEYREKFGEEEYKEMMAERIRQKMKYKMRLTANEESFVETFPDLVGEGS